MPPTTAASHCPVAMARLAEAKTLALDEQAAVFEHAVGQLGLLHPGGAGAHEHADASGAVTRARRCHRRAETVLLQAEIRQAVVAAFPVGPVGRQRLIETCNLADPGLQGAALEAPV